MTGIREKRIEAGKRQIDVATECGVSMTTVYLWDKGVFNNMREENRIMLKKCLNLTDSELPQQWKYNRK